MIDIKQKQYPLSKNILARKFIIYILLFSSLVTLIGTSLQLYLDYSKDRTNIQSTLDQIEMTHVQSIVNNLWLLDSDLVNVQLQGILSLPDVQYVAILSDGKEKISFGTRESEKILSQEYPLIYFFRNKEVSLGSLQVEATLDNALQRLRSRVFVILLTQGIKTLLVSSFIFFVFYALVGRHLEKLATYSSTLTLDCLKTSISFERKKSKNSPPDELDTVAKTINDMNTRLAKDIEARQQAEESLKISNERYHQITTNLPGLVFRFMVHTDGSSSISYISQGVQAMFGVSQKEVYQDINSLMQLMHPDDVQDYERLLERSAESLSPYNYEFRAVINNKVMWIDVRSLPKQSENGDIAWDGIMVDISSRKQAENELQESKYQFEKIIRQSPMPMVITDERGDIKYFNNQFSKIFGYTLDDVSTAKQWWTAAYPDKGYRLLVQQSWQEAITEAEEKGIGIETQVFDITCKDRSVRHAEFNMTPLGEISVILVNDITERSKMEEELEKHRENLEEKIRERTKELKTIVNLMAGREIRMAGLKKTIKKLRTQVAETGL